MAKKKPPKEQKENALPKDARFTGRAIITWVCGYCGWANDHGGKLCRKCGKDG